MVYEICNYDVWLLPYKNQENTTLESFAVHFLALFSFLVFRSCSASTTAPQPDLRGVCPRILKKQRASAMKAFALLALAAPFVAEAQQALDVPGFGRIEVRKGAEPSDEVERFAQLTRAATGHAFPATELQGWVDTFCAEPSGSECKRPQLGWQSLELGGVGTIEVAPGQAPAEAVDAFLVRAKSSGKVSGLDGGGVAQVLEYFCSRKPCATGEVAAPLELPVQGMGVVSVAFGEEVADGVERFAYAARAQGLPLDGAGAAQIAAALCARKTCLRPLNLPPTSLEIQGVGTLQSPFGEAPVVAVERFARAVREQQARSPLEPVEVQQILDALCQRVPCREGETTLAPVSLDVEGVGTCVVDVGQEPADAARLFLQEAIQNGHEVDTNGAEGLMRALCARKSCTKPLDLTPAQLNVQGVGTLAVPLGADPVSAAESFLERAREAGHNVGSPGAQSLMQGLCGLPTLQNACTRPLNVAPLKLEIDGIGTLEVPFGGEPADAVESFVTNARANGVGWLEASHASTVMERLCALKPCFKPLDVRPLSLPVEGIGTLEIPFNQEPAEGVMRFLLEARAAGHVLNREAARQLMTAVCAQRNCLVPLDVQDFSLEVEGIGTFVVPFGSEPAATLTVFADRVVGAGGTLNAQGAAQIMERACAEVTCFVPLDVRPVTIPVESVGNCSVPWGTNPSDAVTQWLRNALANGHAVNEDLAGRLMDAVCSEGRRRAPLGGGAIQYCHGPLDLRPFEVDVAEVGKLTVPWNVPEPATAVASFVSAALDAGHAIDAAGVAALMSRVCAVRPCSVGVDTSPTLLNVTDYGQVEVPFGRDPADAVRTFISHCAYEGKPVAAENVQAIMNNLCSRTTCRKTLSLAPVELPVQGVGTLVVPHTAVPQEAVRAFGNQHRLSPHMMQQIMNSLCNMVPCEAEIPPKDTAA